LLLFLIFCRFWE